MRANFWLFGLSLLLCCVIYPGLLLGIGHVVVPAQTGAHAGLLTATGSRSARIDRPTIYRGRILSAASVSRLLQRGRPRGPRIGVRTIRFLRDRVARQLGPIARYRTGDKAHQLVGPDVEKSFQQNRFGQKPGIVAQWAQAHPAIARSWATSDSANSDAIVTWKAAHTAEVSQWIHENPDTPEPKPEDLAALYLVDFAQTHSGAFPVASEQKQSNGATEKDRRARQRRARKFRRRFSTCGCRTTRGRNWNRCRPIW